VACEPIATATATLDVQKRRLRHFIKPRTVERSVYGMPLQRLSVEKHQKPFEKYDADNGDGSGSCCSSVKPFMR